jgi:predicted aspartyl protease
MRGVTLREMGYYQESANFIKDFLSQVSELTKIEGFPYHIEDFPNHISLAKMSEEMHNNHYPNPEIIRPNKDTEIPVTIKNVAKGTNIFVPVTVKGKTYPFIFDTGAGSSFVSERFANEIGIRIIRDSVPIKGVETCIGKLGTIDSLMVGDIIFKNPIILVANNTPEVDSIFQVEAVLGLDFIKRAGETQIFPQEGKIVFPQHQSSLPPTGRNLLLEDGQSYIKALSGNERLRFHFDTGNVTGCLLKPYYFKHKEKIDATYTKETARHGGFCGYQTVEEYTLPHIPLKVGAVEFDFTDIKVAIDSVLTIEKTEDGSLGMDFIKKFKVITINYDKMFVEVEK